MKMINKKGFMSVAVYFLVILTLVLVLFTIVSFVIRDKDIKEEVGIPRVIDEIYIEEALIKFHARNIFDVAVENMNNPDRGIFVQRFREELERYKNKDGEYYISNLDVAEIDESNVEVLGEKLILEIPIRISKIRENSEKESVDVFYSSSASFEKVFK
jgi:hypothetical protein